LESTKQQQQKWLMQKWTTGACFKCRMKNKTIAITDLKITSNPRKANILSYISETSGYYLTSYSYLTHHSHPNWTVILFKCMLQ